MNELSASCLPMLFVILVVVGLFIYLVKTQ